MAGVKQLISDSVVEAADSLPSLLGGIELASGGQFLSDSLTVGVESLATTICSAEEIYGSGSTLSAEILNHISPLNSYTSGLVSWEFGLFSLLALVVYCLVLSRYRDTIEALFRSSLRINDTLTLYSSQYVEFRNFIKIGVMLWYSILSIALATLIYRYMSEDLHIYNIILYCSSFLLISSLWTMALRKGLSYFDYNIIRWVSINKISLFNKSLSAIIFTPIFIIFSLTEQTHTFILYAIVLLTIYHFLRIIIYFKFSGFSFLQSFLYICSVEMLPFALAWGVVSKGYIL